MSHPHAIANHDPIDSTTRTMELAMQAAQRGAADAQGGSPDMDGDRALRQPMVYTTCYTTAYGVVYPTVLLARSVSTNNAAAQGLIDGAAHRAPESRRVM